jgi:ribosomal protein S18 acetylase RimI-like enzyme
VNRINELSAFHIHLPGFTSRSLTADDVSSLQRLLETCADYTEIVEGTAVSPAAAEELLQSLPPGKSISDKFVAGIFNRADEMGGVLDAVANYPEENIWWIGLLLLAPDVRQRGVGRNIVEALVAFVRNRGGRAVMLGVVEDNRRAFRFWSRNGFDLVRKSEPRSFGNKVQSVFIMERKID